jgi:hypothetical protein
LSSQAGQSEIGPEYQGHPGNNAHIAKILFFVTTRNNTGKI